MIEDFLQFAEEVKQLKERSEELEKTNHLLRVKINGLNFTLKGYEQAREASSLLWRGIERVVTAENDIIERYDRTKIDRMTDEEYYTRILERYNELKDEGNK